MSSHTPPPNSQVATEAKARKTVRDLFAVLDAQGQGDYIGENVSQLAHSLQAAALAAAAGADEPTVLAALLHDVGRFIPAAEKMPRMVAKDGTYVGTASHEVLGEQYLKELGFGENVYEVVGAHVWAKRYLCATEEGYWEALSKSSKTTLEFQGGPFNDEQVEAAQQDPLLAQKLNVRRWDDLAKVPGAVVPNLSSYEDLAVNCLLHE